MTQPEHKLIVTMLAQQLQISLMILDILEAKEVLVGDDLAAFASLPQPPETSIARVGALYRQVAQLLGVDVR